ncbi:MAG: type VI secretion system tube protein Hcp, partial [Candidatus Rokuibacteriota bacterium]
GSGRDTLQFELLSYGFAPSGAGSATGGGGAGKVTFNELKIVKVTDKASPKLFKACAAGVHYKSATVVLRKKGGGGTKQVYLTIKLDQVIVSSFQAGSGGGGGTRPVESITLNFANSQLEYQ